MKRSGQRFGMNGEVIVNVAEYKYLGCLISQHVEKGATVADLEGDPGVQRNPLLLVLCKLLGSF